MANVREEVHEQIDLMHTKELLGFQEFLTTYPTPAAAARRAAAVDATAVTDEKEATEAETVDQE